MSKLLIDKKDLKLLLETKRDQIGHSSLEGIDLIITGGTFFLSTLSATYSDVWCLKGYVIKTVCILLGIGILIWGIFKMVKSREQLYGHQKLFDDITELNTITHPFSIVAIRDTYNKFPARYLVYYDKRWGCRLFLNYRTVQDNVSSLRRHLSAELQIDEKSIAVEYKCSEIYSKFSCSDNIEKIYDHQIYLACISKFREELQAAEFEINGKSFYWMTMDEMESDKDIQEKNMDVIKLIKKANI